MHGIVQTRPMRPAVRAPMVFTAALLAFLALTGTIWGSAGSAAPMRAHNVTGTGHVAPATVITSTRKARVDALSFLRHYEMTDGRVVRTDQGGDTVSEGQAYAMLLAVATHEKQDFADAWQWEQQNLALPDGLFAYHWSTGAVVDPQPATDADLDTAWALLLASRTFGDHAYRADALQVAGAILRNETVEVRGRLYLVAGPWARTVPAVVDPSYLAPEALSALAGATKSKEWSELETDSASLLAELATGSPRPLPPDWADLETDGFVQAADAPSSGGPVQYGLDAQRVPVREAASCSQRARRLAADDWLTLQHVADGGGAISYTLTGASPASDVNPLGLAAAAAAASAAGQAGRASGLLDQADWQAERFPTYYGDAWVALGRYLLDTSVLGTCSPS
jgi:endoglucanase